MHVCVYAAPQNSAAHWYIGRKLCIVCAAVSHCGSTKELSGTVNASMPLLSAVSTDAISNVWSVMLGLAAHTHMQIWCLAAAE